MQVIFIVQCVVLLLKAIVGYWRSVLHLEVQIQMDDIGNKLLYEQTDGKLRNEQRVAKLRPLVLETIVVQMPVPIGTAAADGNNDSDSMETMAACKLNTSK